MNHSCLCCNLNFTTISNIRKHERTTKHLAKAKKDVEAPTENIQLMNRIDLLEKELELYKQKNEALTNEVIQKQKTIDNIVAVVNEIAKVKIAPEVMAWIDADIEIEEVKAEEVKAEEIEEEIEEKVEVFKLPSWEEQKRIQLAEIEADEQEAERKMKEYEKKHKEAEKKAKQESKKAKKNEEPIYLKINDLTWCRNKGCTESEIEKIGLLRKAFNDHSYTMPFSIYDPLIRAVLVISDDTPNIQKWKELILKRYEKEGINAIV
jgi:hypothetical protein